MKQKAITIRFNDYVYGKIESHRINKRLLSFNEALNDLFLELIRVSAEQEETKKIETKNAESIDTMNANIKIIASYIKSISDKK